MKRLIILLVPVMLLTACDVYVVEPRYDSRDNLVGYYDMEEYSETYNDYTYYAVRISKSDYNDQRIYLHNFYAADITVTATLDYDKLRIPNQIIDGYEIEGVGTLVNNNDLRLSYRVRDRYKNTYTDFCETKARRDY